MEEPRQIKSLGFVSEWPKRAARETTRTISSRALAAAAWYALRITTNDERDPPRSVEQYSSASSA